MIDDEQLWAIQARLIKARKISRDVLVIPEDAAEDECTLQEQIIRDARERGWWVHFSRMDLPTTSPKGSPDLLIFAPKGRLIIIEAKSRKGKIRPEQMGVKLMLEGLGHTVHIVRSFGEYLKLI